MAAANAPWPAPPGAIIVRDGTSAVWRRFDDPETFVTCESPPPWGWALGGAGMATAERMGRVGRRCTAWALPPPRFFDTLPFDKPSPYREANDSLTASPTGDDPCYLLRRGAVRGKNIRISAQRVHLPHSPIAVRRGDQGILQDRLRREEAALPCARCPAPQEV